MASPMERIPLEILSIIASHLVQDTLPIRSSTERLHQNSLARYSHISRQWQPVIERITFRHLLLLSDDLATALQHNILTPQRLSYLRYIKLWIKFPRHQHIIGILSPLESDDNFVFSNAIKSLFCLLAPTPFRPKPFIVLELSIPIPKSIARIARRTSDPRAMERAQVARAVRPTFYLELLGYYYKRLPNLPMVIDFRINLSSHSMLLEPRSACLIASKMPRLEAADWALYDGNKTDMTLRVRLRDGLAENIHKLPQYLKRFSLDYFREAPRDHFYKPPSIIPTDAEGDTLSNSLYHFTQRKGLSDFYFKGSVDTTILWPAVTDPTKTPCWPTMKNYTLSMHMIMPSGRWLVVDDKEAAFAPTRPNAQALNDIPMSYSGDRFQTNTPGEAYKNDFRSNPNTKLADRIFFAAGKCVGQMPRVERFTLDFSDSPLHTSLEFDMIHSGDIPCINFSGLGETEPCEDTIQIWRETAEKRGKKFGFKMNK
ncbi:hypothetical protein G7Z17_g165 [Cylindrodendrum hubeiense]|uniref:F-box domain-containing protein n=1 Tax=Cylindrodendrum hubeiense TaxID=595255 RepID=A0A9P5LGJ0_9HYPO|nr:hypothetical protein G7Z17_g165 [Cylindrodendrum hubeiense]